MKYFSIFFFSFQLPIHIPRESLPISLGGTLEIDHAAWLRHCHLSMTNRHEDDPPPDIMTALCNDVKRLDDKVGIKNQKNS